MTLTLTLTLTDVEIIINLVENEIDSNLSFLDDVEGEEKEKWLRDIEDLKQLKEKFEPLLTKLREEKESA